MVGTASLSLTTGQTLFSNQFYVTFYDDDKYSFIPRILTILGINNIVR
jgi:hypothetical protein